MSDSGVDRAQPVVLAEGQDPLAIAVDADFVYWTNYTAPVARIAMIAG